MSIVVKVVEVWCLVAVVVTALWIAAHGGIRSDR
jgi:hypothetical protein